MELLQVKNGKIVGAQDRNVQLRGVCAGGWMNMEHFLNGYPGDEHGLRAAVAQVLGSEKARFFFDRWLDYAFAEEDVEFIKSCGATVVRLPLNYRHFERDDEPFKYLEAGFERLDRAIRWCAKHRLYAILDLHAVQGWQNPDWHCDNSSRHSFFWQHQLFQDRFVALWEEFARRYKGNTAVAGYNLMNEPVTNAPHGRFGEKYTPDFEIMNRVYRRAVTDIRRIDPDHIIFLEGDLFSTRFAGLDAPFTENLVYSSHNYNSAGFGRGRYPGEIDGAYWDRTKQEEVFLQGEGAQFMLKHNVPLWVGEFGGGFGGPVEEYSDRMRAVSDQIAVFEQYGVHWTTWAYKDIGSMSWLHVAPDSAYMQAIAPILEAKRMINPDFGVPSVSPAKELEHDLAVFVARAIGDAAIEVEHQPRYFGQAALSCYAASLMQPAFAKCFLGMSEEKIDEIMQSWAFKRCLVRDEFIEVIKKHTK